MSSVILSPSTHAISFAHCGACIETERDFVDILPGSMTLMHSLPLKRALRACQVVCDFCETHLEANKAAFADPRFQLVVDDARAQLEKWPGTFDVIVGDLADPVYGGPCYQAGTVYN